MEKIIAIVGLTSSGKSDLGIELAQRFNGEIVSADSRQVYKGLDYCSGKVTKEEINKVKHYLIDEVNLGSNFSLFDYQKLAYEKIDLILKSKKIPFLVGGTGLYVRAVCDGYNLSLCSPKSEIRNELQEKTKEELESICKEKNIVVPVEITKRRLIRLLESNNEQNFVKQENNPRYNVLKIGISWSREEIYQRIEERLKVRLPNMINEIKKLRSEGIDDEYLISLGLEAKYVTKFLKGEFDSEKEFFDKLLLEERHFAKRQQTWFNKEKNVVWLDAKDNLIENASKLIQKFLES